MTKKQSNSNKLTIVYSTRDGGWYKVMRGKRCVVDFRCKYAAEEYITQNKSKKINAKVSKSNVPTQKELTKFAIKLSTVMIEAGQLGLFKTQHSIHDAVRTVGWEIEYILEKIKE